MAPTRSGAVSPSDSSCPRASSVAHLAPCVRHEPVDDQDVDCEQHQRPDRVSGYIVELPNRVDARDGDPEPARYLAAAEEAERSNELKHAEDENDPTPGVEVAEHERLMGRVDPRVRDRKDALQHIERPDEPEHDGRERDPAAALDVVGLHVGTPGVIGTCGHAVSYRSLTAVSEAEAFSAYIIRMG